MSELKYKIGDWVVVHLSTNTNYSMKRDIWWSNCYYPKSQQTMVFKIIGIDRAPTRYWFNINTDKVKSYGRSSDIFNSVEPNPSKEYQTYYTYEEDIIRLAEPTEINDRIGCSVCHQRISTAASVLHSG